IQEIFPDAPPGMIVFRFENGTGWAASQKYVDGWSTPDLVMRPLLGAYAVLPPGVSYTGTISGALPADNPVLYSGWHIISTKLLKPATGPAIVPAEANQIGVRQADGQIKVSYF